ncbi:MAG: repressor LexA [Spirochaetaceae bacterium]|nr:repressor LexA [Spirochaetaceae bacterium]MBO7136401.1 repressor LexA [Spirochaetaceae bacterium]MBO7421395.1 repressor LexA [Spirochaetaceae bacterium]MBP5792540.1 repressor LexA [Spirochaetaceae bacterium]
MKALTECQQESLRYIRDYTLENSRPPTIREVAEHFGVTVKAAQDRITALRKKQFLAPSDNCSRSLRILVDIDEKEKENSEMVSVPLLGTIAVGKPLICADNTEGRIFVPSSFLRKDSEYFALTVKGESMSQAGILDGDTALIQQCETAEDGEIIVVLLDDTITLKRYFKEPSRIRLQSENPDFKPIYCQDVRILGRLSTIIRIY